MTQFTERAPVFRLTDDFLKMVLYKGEHHENRVESKA